MADKKAEICEGDRVAAEADRAVADTKAEIGETVVVELGVDSVGCGGGRSRFGGR